MREIKFRAWDGQKMHANALFTEIKPAQVFEDVQLSAYYAPSISNCSMNVLMQFTGVCDRKGAEIYEGDILQDYFWRTGDDVHSVESRPGYFATISLKRGMMGYLWSGPHNLEVIGNIYEHPELMTQGRAS